MATNTYVALQSQTLTGSAASVTFSSIPQGYTDLVLVYSAKVSSAADLGISFNGVTGSSYSTTYLSGNGSSAASARSSNAGATFLDYYGYPDSTNFNVGIFNIQNYSNTTTFKTILGRSNNASTGTDAIVGTYRDTGAITSITIDPVGAPTLSTGSTFTLYGIAAEGTSPAPKATGGVIYSDSTYYYHTFPATGTFTPLQSLTADVLVVAGGGAGGAQGGGGGAGGLLYAGAQSLTTSTAYTATIGGGGAAALNVSGADGVNSSFAGSGFSTMTATGGGGGGSGNTGQVVNGRNGGSGGGAGIGPSGTGGTGVSGQGFAGGGAPGGGGNYPGGGGGGSSVVGGTPSNNTSPAGNGGNGVSTYSSWGIATGIGQNVSGTYYIAGGGGGGIFYNPAADGTAGLGGYGGGSNGTGQGYTTANAIRSTGSGGGGTGNPTSGIAGNGGSGIVIIRYLKA